MVTEADYEDYAVFCIAPSLIWASPVQGSSYAQKGADTSTYSQNDDLENSVKTFSSQFKAGDFVQILGTKVTGTLVEYFATTGYWVIKTSPGCSVDREYQPETRLRLK